MNKKLIMLLLATAIAGCNSSDSKGTGPDDDGTDEDGGNAGGSVTENAVYGEYSNGINTDDLEVLLRVSRYGAINLEFGDNLIYGGWAGSIRVDFDEENSFTQALTVRNANSNLADVELTVTNLNPDLLAPTEYTLKSDDLGIEQSGTIATILPQETEGASLALLNKDFLGDEYPRAYEYLGDGKVTFVSDRGCEVEANVYPSYLLSWEYDVEVTGVRFCDIPFVEGQSGFAKYMQSPDATRASLHAYADIKYYESFIGVWYKE